MRTIQEVRELLTERFPKMTKAEMKQASAPEIAVMIIANLAAALCDHLADVDRRARKNEAQNVEIMKAIRKLAEIVRGGGGARAPRTPNGVPAAAPSGDDGGAAPENEDDAGAWIMRGVPKDEPAGEDPMVEAGDAPSESGATGEVQTIPTKEGHAAPPSPAPQAPPRPQKRAQQGNAR